MVKANSRTSPNAENGSCGRIHTLGLYSPRLAQHDYKGSTYFSDWQSPEESLSQSHCWLIEGVWQADRPCHKTDIVKTNLTKAGVWRGDDGVSCRSHRTGGSSVAELISCYCADPGIANTTREGTELSPYLLELGRCEPLGEALLIADCSWASGHKARTKTNSSNCTASMQSEHQMRESQLIMC